MADYVQSNINVSISENCFDEAYYIHFGYLYIENDYVTAVKFDGPKRYIIDSSGVRNEFPNLYSNSYYNKTSLKLDTLDSFLGSKVHNEDTTIISLIYPNEFFKTNKRYCVAFVTGSAVKQIDDIVIPYSYRYNLNSMQSHRDTVEAVSNVIKSYDNSKWLYLIDCQWITNIWCSYVIHFYIQQSKNKESIQDITINLHTIKDDSHQTDISDFANSIESQKVLSHFILNNSLKTTYNKMNGLLTANPLQHRLTFFGTPYGYTADNFEVVTQTDWSELSTGSYSYYQNLLEEITTLKKKTDTKGKYKFGNSQINKLSYNSGSYEFDYDKDKEEQSFRKYRQEQIFPIIYNLFLNEYQNPKYGAVLTEKGFEPKYDDKTGIYTLTINFEQINLFEDIEAYDIRFDNKNLLNISTDFSGSEIHFLENKLILPESKAKAFNFANDKLIVKSDQFIVINKDTMENELAKFNNIISTRFDNDDELIKDDYFNVEFNIENSNTLSKNDLDPDQLIKLSFMYFMKKYDINIFSFLFEDIKKENNTWRMTVKYNSESEIDKAFIKDYKNFLFDTYTKYELSITYEKQTEKTEI